MLVVANQELPPPTPEEQAKGMDLDLLIRTAIEAVRILI